MAIIPSTKTILDCISQWTVALCPECGSFVDVSWMPDEGYDADAPLPDQGLLCPDCFMRTVPDRFTRLFDYLRETRADLRVDTLGPGTVTLMALSASRGDVLVFDFEVMGFVQSQDPVSNADLAQYPPFASCGHLPLYPPGDPLEQLARQRGVSEATEESVSIILGHDVLFLSSREHMRVCWNPVRPTRPFTVSLMGADNLPTTKKAALLRRGDAAIRGPRTGRPRKCSVEELTTAVMAHRRQTDGDDPTRDEMARVFRVDPDTITHTVRREAHEGWDGFLDSLPRGTRHSHIIRINS